MTVRRDVTNRQLRVFISSTFRDMQAERDYLVKNIFPQLRKLCASRGVTWGEVDLRWGIPDEDQVDVLPLCLEEIRRCSYFIGLLGERYGTVLEEIPSGLIDKYPWLSSHRQKSITELEIQFGCLAQTQVCEAAMLYFRDPAYLDRLPPGSRRSDFECASSLTSRKLARLKEEIREVARKGGCALREGYHSIQDLGEWILGDFTRLIDQEFPADQIPTPIDRELVEQQTFASDKMRVYIERPDAFARLNAYIASDAPPLVLVGEPGVGKTALLANWYRKLAARVSYDYSLIHFIGSTQDSTNPSYILRRIMLELKRNATTAPNLPEKVPIEPEVIRQDFPDWIARAASTSRLILIMDGLNHLEEDGAGELGWLPDHLPSNCRLILSTTPGHSLEATRRRGWDEMIVSPLSVNERRQLLVEFLAQFGRRLGRDHTDQINSAEQTANPLFLRTMLEELRQFGEHERLGERIAYYLRAQTLTQLFDRILQRLEEDYQPELDLARKSLSWIACARYGLSESELLEMLGGSGQPMPFRKWTPFSLAIEPYMVNSSGLLDFATPYLRQAVEERYVATPQLKQQVHRRLATYFEFLPLPTELYPEEGDQAGIALQPFSLAIRRVLDELPWQEARAHAWQSLVDTLTLLPLFEAANHKDQGFEWLAYWQVLRQAEAAGQIAQLDIPGLYLHEFHQLGDRRKLILAGTLGLFLRNAGFPKAAAECFRFERERYGNKVPVFIRAINLNDQAQVLVEQDKPKEALALFGEAEQLLRQDTQSLETRRSLATVLMNRANLMRDLGTMEGVEAMLQEALVLMRETTGEDSPEVATVLQSCGNLVLSLGDSPRALELQRQAYEMRVKRLGARHRDVGISLVNLGNVLATQGKIFRSIECFQQAVDIFLETLGAEHPFSRHALDGLEQLRKLER